MHMACRMVWVLLHIAELASHRPVLIQNASPRESKPGHRKTGGKCLDIPVTPVDVSEKHRNPG